MLIGIDASRALKKERTGTEEYSYQVITRLRGKLQNQQVILYAQTGQVVDFELPPNWQVKTLWFPRLWTQVRLSWELFWHPVDVLFVSAHAVPVIHPRKTVAVVHGLEYEFMPAAYSWWERTYAHYFMQLSCRWAQKIIAVSKNTRQDLIDKYKVPGEKITVIYEGHAASEKRIPNTKYQIPDTKYLLFIGRLGERKNIGGIIAAFEILKEQYHLPHQLILVGKPGFGYGRIQQRLSQSKYKNEVVLKGFVTPAEKQQLLQGADVFLFPSFYEGFGLPVLEAQQAGVAVVASNVSSLPEVAGQGALFVDPREPVVIAQMVAELISNPELKNDIINKGFENLKRFSWEKCASEIAEVLLK